MSIDSKAAAPAPVAVRRTSPATDLALIAAFAGLIVACALMPTIHAGVVPITLQTFGVLLTGAILGPRRGFLAVLLYLALGAIGLPVFADGAAGVAVFAGPSVGYLLGFPLAAAFAGFLVERLYPRAPVAIRPAVLFLCGLAGSAAFIHTLGVTGLVLRADMSWAAAWKFELTFLPGDLVKNGLMAVVATAVLAAFPDLLRRRTRSPKSATEPASGTITT